MTRQELQANTDAAINKGKSGLQKLWDKIPQGVRKQLLKDAEVKDTLDIYSVDYGGKS